MTSYGSINTTDNNSGKINPDEPIDETKPLVDDDNVSKAKIQSAERSLWSRLTFKWFAEILELGNQNNRLNQEDLDMIPLPKDCETDEIIATFDKHWQEELEKDKPSLVRALTRSFGWEYFLAALLKLVHDLNVFVGPQVLHAIIVFLRDPEAPLWHGLGLTLAVTISQIAMSLCLRHYFFKVRKIRSSPAEDTSKAQFTWYSILFIIHLSPLVCMLPYAVL